MNATVVYENDVDALKATVLALGGYQKVGGLLYPDKSAAYAGRNMADCCNPNRSERLSPSQLLYVMRLARDKGCHILAEHYMAEAGYAKPVPIDPDEEAGDILQRIDGALETFGALVGRLERVRSAAPRKAAR